VLQRFTPHRALIEKRPETGESGMKIKEFGVRLAVAGLGIPLILACTLYGRLVFTGMIILIEVLALLEFYRLNAALGIEPNRFFGVLTTIIIALDLYYTRFNVLVPVTLASVMLIMGHEMLRNKKQAMANMGVTILGILYIGLFGSLILIREFRQDSLPYLTGGWLVMQIFFTIWICDTAAYLWGKKFGRHSLFKRVSPKKTWEGAVAGFIGGILGSFLVRFLFIPETSVRYAFALGLIIGILGQTGDLIESFIKRHAGVKDSGGLLPGHGGFLDRFDSQLFVAPLVYLYISLFGI
jgi:phosphatidate cytidylyltransferase